MLIQDKVKITTDVEKNKIVRRGGNNNKKYVIWRRRRKKFSLIAYCSFRILIRDVRDNMLIWPPWFFFRWYNQVSSTYSLFQNYSFNTSNMIDQHVCDERLHSVFQFVLKWAYHHGASVFCGASQTLTIFHCNSIQSHTVTLNILNTHRTHDDLRNRSKNCIL